MRQCGARKWPIDAPAMPAPTMRKSQVSGRGDMAQHFPRRGRSRGDLVQCASAPAFPMSRIRARAARLPDRRVRARRAGAAQRGRRRPGARRGLARRRREAADRRRLPPGRIERRRVRADRAAPRRRRLHRARDRPALGRRRLRRHEPDRRAFARRESELRRGAARSRGGARHGRRPRRSGAPVVVWGSSYSAALVVPARRRASWRGRPRSSPSRRANTSPASTRCAPRRAR